MSLRARLVCTLVLTALVPMAVTVGVPLLRADARAAQEVARRLDLASRQARLVLERERGATGSAVTRAALDRAWTMPAGGPVALLADLARRHGLDLVEVIDPAGTVLATTRPGIPPGAPSPFASVVRAPVAIREIPSGSPGDPSWPGPIAWYPVRQAGPPLLLIGGRRLDEELLSEIAATTGQPVSLRRHGEDVLRIPRGAQAGRGWTSGGLTLGDRWELRVWTPAGDAGQVRRDLLGAFAGIAPLAIGSALLVGFLLAEGIARPIRALARRADTISAERAGWEEPRPAGDEPVGSPGGADEVRRLTRSFDRMIDALSRSEGRRLAAERVAAWQEVARRIAHEVKNPLTPIQLAVENLRRTRTKAPADLDRALDEETAAILEEVGSLRALVDEFSAFARLPAPQPVPTDLAAVVRHALHLLGPRLAAAGIAVSVRDEGIPPHVAADPEQIGRAVKNVVLNAIDAMEATADRRLQIRLARVPGPGGDRVDLSFRDRGPGIPVEMRDRVFEPYFTTRGESGGTGLGMAIVHRILTEHGGAVLIGSPPGGGAEVVLRLPMTAAPPGPPRMSGEGPRGSERSRGPCPRS